MGGIMDLAAIELKLKIQIIKKMNGLKKPPEDLREMQFRIFADSSAEVEKRRMLTPFLGITEIERLLNVDAVTLITKRGSTLKRLTQSMAMT